MSPETEAALHAGKPLNKIQFMEVIDDEARASGLSGADEAIDRARTNAPPISFREMRVRLLVTQLDGR